MTSAMKHPRVALDLESNGFHRYPERVCLIQLSVADEIYLIDPLAIEDMTPLGVLLSAPSVVKIFHSADYDIRSLDRDWGFRVSPLFDTSIGAAFRGHTRLGLAALIYEWFEVEIPKTKRLQRADWTVRPLSAELREYAAADVYYLATLTDLLSDRLRVLGRTAWVREECERLANVRYVAPDCKSAFLSVKGSRKLNGQGLAVLRALYFFRDGEALRRDCPPFKVFSNTAMLALAENPRADLSTVKGLGRYAYGRGASGARKSLQEGMDAEPVVRPRANLSARPRVQAEERSAIRKRLQLLKQWRLEHARHLDIDAGLLWPAASLERLSANPSILEEEFESREVRRWQREEFGASLSAFLSRFANLPE